jgi:hypothetical protein
LTVRSTCLAVLDGQQDSAMIKKYATTSGLIVAEIAGDSSIRKAASRALGVPQQRLFKEGHRETFPGIIRREGFLYVINRAISS